MPENLYERLQVSPEASQKQIKKAFRRLAKRHHPDLHPEAPQSAERFKAIHRAYRILSDRRKRAVYDRKLKADVSFSESKASKKTAPEGKNQPAAEAWSLGNSGSFGPFLVLPAISPHWPTTGSKEALKPHKGPQETGIQTLL